MKITIVDLGYMGLPVSLQFARSVTIVLGLDVDQGEVDRSNLGKSYAKQFGADSIAPVTA